MFEMFDIFVVGDVKYREFEHKFTQTYDLCHCVYLLMKSVTEQIGENVLAREIAIHEKHENK